MRLSFREHRFLLCATIITSLGAVAAGADAVADTEAVSILDDPNDLRWDLAEPFKFDWESTELSIRIVQEADSVISVRTLTIAVGLAILDFHGSVILDTNGPGIREVLDQDGNPVECETVESDQSRRYDARNWYWGQGWSRRTTGLQPFKVALRLSSDPTQTLPSSISELAGFIYAIYADDVIKVDIPFDPNGGWTEAKADSDLILRVDKRTGSYRQ